MQFNDGSKKFKYKKRKKKLHEGILWILLLNKTLNNILVILNYKLKSIWTGGWKEAKMEVIDNRSMYVYRNDKMLKKLDLVY